MPEETTNTNPDAAKRAEEIAAEGEDVRERIRTAVVDAMTNREGLAEDLSNTTQAVLDGAVEGVRNLAPEQQDSTLRQVVDGLGDALSRSANATRFALEEARSRGESFAREDIDRAMQDLRTLEEMFVNLVDRTARRAGDELSGQFTDLSEHARRTASNIRPSIESALSEAGSHPVKLAGEAATAGVKAVPRAAGMLLQAVGGALQGAGDVLGGSAKTSDESAVARDDEKQSP